LLRAIERQRAFSKGIGKLRYIFLLVHTHDRVSIQRVGNHIALPVVTKLSY